MSAAPIHCPLTPDQLRGRMADPIDHLIDLTIQTRLLSTGNYKRGIIDEPFFVADLGQVIHELRRWQRIYRMSIRSMVCMVIKHQTHYELWYKNRTDDGAQR
jgi:hypothetical protein